MRLRPSIRDVSIVLVLVAIVVALALLSPAFRSSQNIKNVLDQVSVLGIATCGMTLVVISGAFDLSQGAIYALAGIVAVMVSDDHGVLVGLVCGVLAGVVVGCINGLIVEFAKVNSLIATLATTFVYGGIATVITGGAIAVTGASEFDVMARTAGFVTVATWLLVLVIVITGGLLAWTSFGRGLYALGGNAEAARLSGLRVHTLRVVVFTISGVCAALAGFIAASRTGSASASMGVASTLALTAVAATVLGGTSIRGGEGSIWRAMIGVLILGLINNGFNLLGVEAVYQNVVYGLLILIAVGLDQVVRGRAS